MGCAGIFGRNWTSFCSFRTIYSRSKRWSRSIPFTTLTLSHPWMDKMVSRDHRSMCTPIRAGLQSEACTMSRYRSDQAPFQAVHNLPGHCTRSHPLLQTAVHASPTQQTQTSSMCHSTTNCTYFVSSKYASISHDDDTTVQRASTHCVGQCLYILQSTVVAIV